MADRSQLQSNFCPLESVLDLINGRWKARIMWHLYENGVLRFGELRRELPGVSERMLARQLRELEQSQLVTRTQYHEIPPRVEYALSEFGRTLGPILNEIAAWGHAHEPSILAATRRDPTGVSL